MARSDRGEVDVGDGLGREVIGRKGVFLTRRRDAAGQRQERGRDGL